MENALMTSTTENDASPLPATILDEAATTLVLLKNRGLSVVTAESCTGGLIAAALTHHSGSSAAVEGGFITYSNAMKTACLGVPEIMLRKHGAVSGEVAGAMAAGALAGANAAAIAVSVTGIAGPDGGSVDKPVGLVWFGIIRRGGSVHTESHRFSGDRTSVRNQTVSRALTLIKRVAEIPSP
ncbi:hypothetical protein AA23498_3276 [Acetobacter nitrogenifigens DSM 23921 = NBRC 105050]|nr:hypothetical protein AA23498_3276 [Acetobacter nitrogenifigens DSM 23921 = NBRC 105050]